MPFNIVLANLPPHLWEMTSDTVHFIKGALEACGEEVTLSTNQIARDATNLFFDRFYEEPEFPRKLSAAGISYGLVCTEVLSEDGTWNYGAENDDPNAFRDYQLAAEGADFVWCVLAESLPACRTMNPRAAAIEFGYLESMETLTPRPWPKRDIDLLMVGLGSPRRGDIVADLMERGLETVYPAIPVPRYVRDALMERTRLNLSLQKTAEHGIVSVSRICHSVINRVPLLLEYTGETPYGSYCVQSGPETLLEDIAGALESDLERHANEAHERLRDQLDMVVAMRSVLAETVRSG